MVAHFILVEKLEIAALYAHDVDLVACGKSVFHDPSVGQTLELGTDEGVSFARFYVLEFDNGLNVVIVLNAQSVTDFCSRSHRLKLLVRVKKCGAKLAKMWEDYLGS